MPAGPLRTCLAHGHVRPMSCLNAYGPAPRKFACKPTCPCGSVKNSLYHGFADQLLPTSPDSVERRKSTTPRVTEDLRARRGCRKSNAGQRKSLPSRRWKRHVLCSMLTPKRLRGKQSASHLPAVSKRSPEVCCLKVD